MNYLTMSNQQRKDWGYENLERDVFDKTAAQRNIEKHGAGKITGILGPSCWPETYGQTPWETTLCCAYDIVNGKNGSGKSI